MVQKYWSNGILWGHKNSERRTVGEKEYFAPVMSLGIIVRVQGPSKYSSRMFGVYSEFSALIFYEPFV